MNASHRYAKPHIDDLTEPDNWVRVARQLADGARELKPKVDQQWDKSGERPPSHYVDIFMMLCAYAIENLLKALIVSRERETIRTKLEAGVPFNTIVKQRHKLFELAGRAGLPSLAQGHKGLLDRLSRSAIWFARYPAPLRPEDYETEDFFGLSKKPCFIPKGSYSSADIRNMQEIMNAIWMEIRKASEDRGLSNE